MQQNVDFCIKIKILYMIIKYLCLKSICCQGTTLGLCLTCGKQLMFSEIIFGINWGFEVSKNGCRVTHVLNIKSFLELGILKIKLSHYRCKYSFPIPTFVDRNFVKFVIGKSRINS